MSVSTQSRIVRPVRAEKMVSKRPSWDFYVAGLVALALIVGILVAEYATKELFVSGFVLLAILAACIGFFAAGRAVNTQRS